MVILPPFSMYPVLYQTLLLMRTMMTIHRYLQAVLIHSRCLIYANHCTATHAKVRYVTMCWITMPAVDALSTNNQWTGEEWNYSMDGRETYDIVVVLPVWNPDMIITCLTLYILINIWYLFVGVGRDHGKTALCATWLLQIPVLLINSSWSIFCICIVLSWYLQINIHKNIHTLLARHLKHEVFRLINSAPITVTCYTHFISVFFYIWIQNILTHVCSGPCFIWPHRVYDHS